VNKLTSVDALLFNFVPTFLSKFDRSIVFNVSSLKVLKLFNLSLCGLLPSEKFFGRLHFVVIVALIRVPFPLCQANPTELKSTSTRHMHASLILRNDLFASWTWLSIRPNPTIIIIAVNLLITLFCFRHRHAFVGFFLFFEILLCSHAFFPQTDHLALNWLVRGLHALETERMTAFCASYVLQSV
jgi:hypothetical protein